MSCFIMQAKALAALAQGLETMLNQGYSFIGIEPPEKLYTALKDCADKYGFYDEKHIYSTLYELNAAAYAGRYREENTNAVPLWPDDVPRLLSRPRYDGFYHPTNDFFKYYKLLDCYLYQTGEDATHNTELYIALRSLSVMFAEYLTRNTAAYNAAEWGYID